MLRGKTISLRTVRENDLDHLYSVLCDFENRGAYDTLGILAEPLFKKDFFETGFWQDNRGTMLILNKEDSIIGSISFFKSIPYFNGFEVGFVIHNSEDRGKGYTSEAANIFVAYLFEVKEINRLQATTLPENTASIRVLEKCGFILEGKARKAMFHKGEYKDVNVYSILRNESKKLQDLILSK
ncbi:MAG: GNAT family N-acetyltransferase [Acidobacteria bacterium]|nr:GNAT family N-acetyltransferase [Acidobacteriota bacterium]